MLSEQTFCDWCYRSIDDEDRHRSRDLGVDDELTWACGKCLDSGRVYVPPDGWKGDADSWPIRDLRDQVQLALENVRVVLADIIRTTRLHPLITVDSSMDAVRISYHGANQSPSVDATENPQALAETAEYLQEHVAEDVGTAGQATLWPVCSAHSRLLQAEARDAGAVWTCPAGHLVSAIGELPTECGPDPSA